MSDDAPAPEIQINVKGASVAPTFTDEDNNALGPSELKLQISITTDKTVLELKQAIAEKSDVGADRQRLIYSGSSFFVLVFLVSTNLLLIKAEC
jgi:ubiquilin